MKQTRLTVVIDYESEEVFNAQKFHVNMDLLGGKVIGVQFDDALETIERLEEQIEILEADLEAAQ